MIHPNQDDRSLLNQIVNHLCTEGSDGFAEALRVLLNHAMQAERSKALGAAPYQRSATRKGHANGFKPKTLQPGSASWLSMSLKSVATLSSIPPLWSAACAANAL